MAETTDGTLAKKPGMTAKTTDEVKPVCEKCGVCLRCVADVRNICRDCWYDEVIASPVKAWKDHHG